MGLVQKAFSDIITFSRSSNATRVGPTGLVEYAPHNLLTYSEQFDNAAWVALNATVTANSTASPNGTVTADKLIATAVSGVHTTRQSPAVTSGVTYTISIYAKQSEYKYLRLVGANSLGDIGANFDLNTGEIVSVNTGVTASIQSIGNGWYRCVCTMVATSTGNGGLYPYLLNNSLQSSFTGDGTSGLFLWGAQFSVGPLALDYTPTTSAAVYGPRFDFDGSGVTSVDPIARNLLTYSEMFADASWTKNNATITANVISAPDGTITADKLVENASSATHYVNQTLTPVSSTTYSFSCFAKAGERSVLWLGIGFTGGGRLGYNLTNGTVVAGTISTSSGSITSVGDGWYRCTLVITTTSTSAGQIQIGCTNAADATTISYTGDGTSGIYIWGAQLEIGSTATGYMPSGATNGFRAVPVVTGSATARGLLVEEQRTNLLTYSEMFADAAWTKTNATITANTVAAPDGTLTADKLVESSGSSAKHFSQSATLAATTSYTQTVYAKAAGRNFLQITSSTNTSGSGSTYQNYDLVNGTLGGSSGGKTATITAMGNGWYRCSYTDSSISAGTGQFVIAIVDSAVSTRLQAYTGDGTSGIFIWGAQLEAGAFATSYIPTVASTVTRSADVASVNTLSPWFNATEGTLFAEFDQLSSVSPSNQWIATISDGTSSNYIGSLTNPTNFRAVVVSGGVSQASMINGAVTANTPVKTAQAFKADDFAATASGAAVVTDTSGTIPTVSQLSLGSINGSNILNGHLRRIAFYPRRLSNAELQALTA